MSSPVIAGRTAAVPASTPSGSASGDDPGTLSDTQLAAMPAPKHIDTLLWRHASPQERRALLEQGGSPSPDAPAGDERAGPPLGAPFWVAGSAVSEQGKAVLRANPELEVRWISTENLAEKSGFTPGLRALLQEHGIKVDRESRIRPDSVVSNEPRHRSTNGHAARDALVAEFRQLGNQVRTEVREQTPLRTERRPSGWRVVDVVVETPGATPETATRLDIESKLGRAGLNDETRLQAAKDGWRLEENGRLRGWGERLDVAGKVIRPVGIVIDAATIAGSARGEGGFGPATQRIAAGVAGGAIGGVGGAWAGAAAGAAVGSVVPVIGTVVGGFVGGILGALAGSWGGEAAAHAAFDAAGR